MRINNLSFAIEHTSLVRITCHLF